MKLTFKPFYFICFCFLLAVELAIALFLKDGFIRFTVGDYLSVMLVYCFFRSVSNYKPIPIAILTLIIAFGIEFLQLFNVLDWLQLRDNYVVATVLGSHFSIQDLIAYSLGTLTILVLDLKFISNENN